MKGKTIKKDGLIGGTIWTSISFVVVTFVYLLRLSILTRFLDKADFGLVAIVLFVLGFTNIFADLGVSTSILSQKKITKLEYSSLYWGGLLLSFLLYIIISLSSFVFADFYDEAKLKDLIPIMGLDLIISSIGRQFSVFKQKEFKFKELAVIKIISEISSLIVASLLAIQGFGVWSLVFSLLTASVINSALNFILGYKSHSLIFAMNIKDTKHLYRIGFFQTGAQILDYISSQIDILILGKILPMSDMGVYSIIKSLVLRIYSSINQIVTKVSIPYFSKLDSKSLVFKTKYLDIIFLVSFINTVIYTIVIISSREILFLLYGAQYREYHYLLGILSVWGFFASVINVASVIIVVATGRTDLGFKWTQIRLLLNPVFILIGGYFFGMIGIAISQAIYSVLIILLYRRVVIRHIIHTMSDYEMILTFIKPLIVAIAIVIFSLLIFDMFKVDNVFISLSLKTITVLIVFTFIFIRNVKETIVKLK
ncbi:MOP flippase family protein [Myroides odoratimimus]|uniref:MOP flippase family protein n=1 Tax=Myroides odoratimimus TaxID=76832 RepID=UPI002578AC75|nr:MOP flippase family protein [Myroides odoratimimus]MDM1517655.1 MOP flippase family protein [Myroides odoratimimus]